MQGRPSKYTFIEWGSGFLAIDVMPWLTGIQVPSSRRWGVGGCEALDLFQKIFQVSREGMILFSDLVSCNGEQRRLDDRGVIDVIR